MEKGNHAKVAVRKPSHRFERPHKIKRSSDSSISDLSDAVLQHILSYIPTKLAITTSVLSKRWRHVWKETPHLSFERPHYSFERRLPGESPKVINKTLARYSASKITSFHFSTRFGHKSGHLNKSIEFATSHNVENFSLALSRDTQYYFPDFSYTNSSMKRVKLRYVVLTPRCTVSWTSLRNLSLDCCKLSDKTFPKILSGCPILETLTLQFCWSLEYLDLSKSLRLTRLEIERRRSCRQAPIQSMQIVAPHIHYLRLRDSEAHCTFGDVSSLTEADVDVSYFHPRTRLDPLLDADVFLVMVQTMMEAFQNVENLTLGDNLLKMLSLPTIPSRPLPMLKVNNLTFKTRIMRSVVPGIERLLQNSPGLNKFTVYINKTSTRIDLLVMLSLPTIPSRPLPMLKVNNLTFKTRIMRSVVPGIERLLQNSPGLNKFTVYINKTSTRIDLLVWDSVNSYLMKQCGSDRLRVPVAFTQKKMKKKGEKLGSGRRRLQYDRTSG